MSAPPPPPYPDWHQHYHSRFSRFGRFGHGGPGGYRGFGLCRRLFWLALGAGAYAFWSSRHQEMERYRQIEGGAAAGVDQDQGCAKRWGCHRRRERESMREQPHWQQHPAPPVMTDHPVVDEKQGLYARVHVGPSPPPSEPQDQRHTTSWTYKDGQWTSTSTTPTQTAEGREASPVAPAVAASNDKNSWLPWASSKPSTESAPAVFEEQRGPAPQAQMPSPVDKAREVRRQAGEAVSASNLCVCLRIGV